jgi:arsenate reductase
LRKSRVLFICVHNSGRSQMAEAFLNVLGGHLFVAESAGFEPQPLNPLVVAVMKEDGLDTAKNQSKSVFDFFKQGKLFDYVITVCDKQVEENCPVFPGITKRLSWNFPDPASFAGSEKERLTKARELREAIKDSIINWLHETKSS